jgi:hypothetical protein
LRLSYALLAAGVLLVAVGCAWWVHPGLGLLVAGGFLVMFGLLRETGASR